MLLVCVQHVKLAVLHIRVAQFARFLLDKAWKLPANLFSDLRRHVAQNSLSHVAWAAAPVGKIEPLLTWHGQTLYVPISLRACLGGMSRVI